MALVYLVPEVEPLVAAGQTQMVAQAEFGVHTPLEAEPLVA